MKLNISLVVFPALILATLAVIFVETGQVGAGVVGAITGAALGGLCAFYLRVRTTLGTFTGFAALAIISALLFALVSWASPACPIPEFEGRCPAYAVGTLTVFGALSPIALGLTLLPFYAFFVMVKWLVELRQGKRPLAQEKIRKFLSLTGIGRSEKQRAKAAESKELKAAKKLSKSGGATGSEESPKEEIIKPSAPKPDLRKKSGPTPKRPKGSAKTRRGIETKSITEGEIDPDN